MSPDEFIQRWKASSGSERANFQQFAIELTQLLDVPAPKPVTADAQNDDYRFERPVTFVHTATQSRGYIDLYRRGSFVMEAKQGVEAKAAAEHQLGLPGIKPAERQGHGQRGSRRWDEVMFRARNQADGYARAISREDGWPPFLLIVDVGHVIEVYADFSGQGQGYTQFPDGSRYRIALDDLRDDAVRDRLRRIWLDPASLNPALVSARVTRKMAQHLAELGKSFEASGYPPEKVARFLMRALFTMFAEDVELIPAGAFSKVLHDLRGTPELAAPMLESLWATMNTGGFSPALVTVLKRFNGGLFRDSSALPLDAVQLSLLIEAAGHDWREVEPSIFGTLLERALDPRQRHKLGAHYTPRPYVERLVHQTVMVPLQGRWRDVQAAALLLAGQGKETEAIETVRAFHQELCEVRVLDPACGSGNFLYVALELMKRLEGEVMGVLADLGDDQGALALAGHTVDPHQFLGIEVNPWAAAVAEMVLWIGYLQWHYRTYGVASPSEPVLRDFRNIENRDAVLAYDGTRPRLDDDGQPATRWDGVTMIRSHVTGDQIPDPDARVALLDYLKPRPATWPDAEFIVGNPPFIGTSKMRETLGDGYAEALRAAYPKVPDSADFVMFWWEKAALAVRAGRTQRLGFITTNSLRQTFNRRVLERHLGDPKTPLSLVYAIPDHPWVDAADGAAVRIAMTVAAAGALPGALYVVTREPRGDADGRDVELSGQIGKIHANLRIGADVAAAKALRANDGLATRGVQLFGAGFIVTPGQAAALGLGIQPGLEKHIRDYRNGRDLTGISRSVMVIDLFGLTDGQVRHQFPKVYQHLLDKVKPERDHNNREGRKKNWWIFGEALSTFRPALASVSRYIATVETSKHRIFQFLDSAILPDNKIVAIALQDAAQLAILSGRLHSVWALAAGSWIGYGNDPVYAKSKCFDPFPFPNLDGDHLTRLRALGEELDAHRKAQQAAHPKLTLTAMYNVLEKRRAGEELNDKDREIDRAGLVGVLADIHARIDAAVADAYGWPADLDDEEILIRLVDLNRERAAEEARGLVRWLRPEYQNPAGHAAKGEQAQMDVGPAETTGGKLHWPRELPRQISMVRDVLGDLGEATPEQVARRFTRGRAATVKPLLETLTAIGQARILEGARFTLSA